MFDEFVSSNGTTAANYEWSGYVLEVLLPYLEENRHIDLMKGGGFDEISARLSAARQATYFILTKSHRDRYLDQLDPMLFSQDELREYYNEFTETDEPDIGLAMHEGIQCIHRSLLVIDEDNVVLLSIG